MKKILLIIAIIFLIFQMAVLATAIDIGNAAIVRAGASSAGFTHIDLVNPANATGKITSIQIYAKTNLANCEVAIFIQIDATHYSTRDTHTIGAVTAGATRTFEVDLDVTEGDYIGIYYTSGTLAMYTYDGNNISAEGDQIPCTNAVFPYTDDNIMSIYGTGATGEEEANAIFMGTNF